MENFLKKSFRDQDRDHRQQNDDHRIRSQEEKQEPILHDVTNNSKEVQLLRSLNLDHRNQDLDEKKHGLVLLHGTDDTNKSTRAVQLLQGLNDDQRKQDLDRNRVCHVCGKTFRSGQALGGHISIHFQPRLGPNKMNFKATKQQVQYYPFLNDKTSCHICNRIFPSRKSLYGHMGSHRKRAESSSMKHKYSSPSSSWPSPSSSPSPPSPSSSSSLSAEYSEHDDRDLIEKDDHGLIDFLSSWGAKKDRRGRSTSTTTSKTLIANQNPNYNCNDVFSSKYCKFPSSKRVKFLDGIKHDQQHVCNVCYKIFPTGQALGGHKRAHYNHEAGPILLLEAAPPAAKIKVSLMEDEDDGVTIDPVVPSPLMQLAEEAIRLQSRRILDLDLNQPPPEEDDWR